MKAVAIPYVIALILGIVVVSLLGYWFVSQGGKTIGVGSTAECYALCSSWRNSAFNNKPLGIDKCPSFSGDSGVDNCILSLGCKFSPVGCGSDETDYGTNVEIGRKVCCRS